MVGRFPDVSLIMVHGGRNWLREDAIEVTKRNSNIYAESSVMYSQYVTRVVEEFSPERVLMSTDSPTEVFEPVFPRWIGCMMTRLGDSAIRINAIRSPRQGTLASPGG